MRGMIAVGILAAASVSDLLAGAVASVHITVYT